jgi:hypothetical protein
MLRKVLFLVMAAMLSLPTFASAYNSWSVSFSSTPVSLLSAVHPPATAHPTLALSGYSTAKGTGSGVAYYTTANSTVTSDKTSTMKFTVDAIGAGGNYLSYVAIDGVKATPVLGVYTVTKGTKISHTLSAVYAQTKFRIVTSKVGNGIIDPTVTVPAAGNQTINVTPAEG